MFAEQNLVAGTGIGTGQQAQGFVGAGAAYDAGGVEPVARADCGAKVRRAAIGIAMQLAGQGLIGCDGFRARSQGAFIR